VPLAGNRVCWTNGEHQDALSANWQGAHSEPFAAWNCHHLFSIPRTPPHAAIGSVSSSQGLGIVEGGSLAGKESASVLSILRSRLQGLGFRGMAWRRLVSSSSGEMITAPVYTNSWARNGIGIRPAGAATEQPRDQKAQRAEGLGVPTDRSQA